MWWWMKVERISLLVGKCFSSALLLQSCATSKHLQLLQPTASCQRIESFCWTVCPNAGECKSRPHNFRAPPVPNQLSHSHCTFPVPSSSAREGKERFAQFWQSQYPKFYQKLPLCSVRLFWPWAHSKTGHCRWGLSELYWGSQFSRRWLEGTPFLKECHQWVCLPGIK